MTFYFHVSLCSSWLWQFLTFLVFYDLNHFEEYWSAILCTPTDVFLLDRLWCWLLGRKTTEVRCHFHHITSRVQTISVTYPCWCSPTWGNIAQISLLLILIPAPCLSHYILWEEVSMKSPYLSNGKLYYTSFGVEYLHNFFEIFLHKRFASSPQTGL